MVSTVGWIVELSDCLEARLLEGADRGPVTSIRPGDAGDRGRLREDDVADERPQHLGAEALARQLFLGDEEVDAGHPIADPDDARVLRVVGDEVRLDETDRTAVEQDEVVVGRVAALDRRPVVRDDVRVGAVLGPPAPHVLTLEPFVQQAKIARLEGPKPDAAGFHAPSQTERQRTTSSWITGRSGSVRR